MTEFGNIPKTFLLMVLSRICPPLTGRASAAIVSRDGISEVRVLELEIGEARRLKRINKG
jgi:hypothetical protein